jgi:superfamily II DNA or RNA helicase/HKD family nuclease
MGFDMFITNTSEKNLEKRLKELIKNSAELKFLVGFFYFSGFKVLYKILRELYEEGKLKEGFLKILVGLNIDSGVYGIYEGAKRLKVFNSNIIKDDFFQSFKKAFTSADLDNSEVYEQVDFFKRLLLENKLIIRKTKEPNHAKLYIFSMDENSKVILPGLFITGSSNLTRAGLESQDEFNVEIKDYGFEDAKNYFDNFWERAIELTPEDVQKLIEILENETFFRNITPFEAYAYLLKIYLDLHQGLYPVQDLRRLLLERKYKPYDYQLSAVSQAVANCEAHSGCILADVVGLGKTIIACVTAKALGKRGIVICPPHLIGDNAKTSGWKKYLEDFKLWDWEVWSLGKLEDALKFVNNNHDFEMVIVDEAHRFRNERTQNYHYLREICRGKTVLLLSATPFNNSPSDIFALLKLFTIPKKSSIVYDGDLEARFKQYETEFKKLAYIKKYWNSSDPKRKSRALRFYQDLFLKKVSSLNSEHLIEVNQRVKKIARKIRSILEPVVIRRNRLDLKYFKDKERIEFPEVKDPIEAFYELTDEQLEFYDKVINSFYTVDEGGRFKGAIYLPILYEKGISRDLFDEPEIYLEKKEDPFLYTYQKSLYDLMRRLLVKRFESSFKAFYESLGNFMKVYEKALEFAQKTNKFILDRRLIERIYEKDEEEILEILENYRKQLEEEKLDSSFYKVYDINKFKLRDEFFRDIESDIQLFKELKEEMEDLNLLEEDPKAQKLVEVVKEFNEKRRKVVIYTEYIDTAKYLKEILNEHFGSRVLTAAGNLSKTIIKKIYANFDAQYKEQRDEYDILLTTDKLSEGFNLNRAGEVINYDIPWNPVRVIQRVGRINRIAKKVYDEIYIVNFFPTQKGADYVRSREIAQTKMFMIHNVLGEDAKIFSPDEEPQASELYRRLTTKPQDEEEESFYTKVFKEYDRILTEHRELVESLKDLPSRIKVAKTGSENELMVFIKRGKDLFVGYQRYDERAAKTTTFEEVFEKIKAHPEERQLPLSSDFWEVYHQILEKSFPAKNDIRTSSKDLFESSQRALKLILEMPYEELNNYHSFISDLIEDITRYRTLSEYVIGKIADFEDICKKIRNYEQEGNKEKLKGLLEKLVSKLEEIKSEIGEDFLDKIEKFLKEKPEEVIIAIENQKIDGKSYVKRYSS